MTHANTVQLYPWRTSEMIGLTTSLYTSICVEDWSKTLSNVNVLETVFSPLTMTSPALELHVTTLLELAFFSRELRGL